MAMSEHQKEQLAWVTRVIMIIGLGIASTVGINVYNMVSEVYVLMKVQDTKNQHQMEVNRDLKEEDKEINMEIKTLRAEVIHLRTKINIQ